MGFFALQKFFVWLYPKSGCFLGYETMVQSPNWLELFRHESVIGGGRGCFLFGCYWIFCFREITMSQCQGDSSHYWFFALSKRKVSFFIDHLSKFFFRQCYVERLIKSVYQCVLNQLSVWKAPTNDSNSRPNFLYFFEVPPQVKYFLWTGVTTLMTSFWCLYC